MGEPHRAMPVVHIAGTNGKGSVCSMVTESLVAQGYRVGTTVSPHIEFLNERVWLDGLPVDDSTLEEAIGAVDRQRWDWARSVGMEEPPLTYFEFMFAVAMWIFADRNVDVAVVEVGLGGRLDATNVVHPMVTAITQIGLDHMEVLGTTIQEIAAEKAGILKQGIPVVTGPLGSGAQEVVAVRAQALRCPLWAPPKLRRIPGDAGFTIVTPEGSVDGLMLSMPGDHQRHNAQVAVGVLHALRRSGLFVSDDSIRTGVSRASISGRIERLGPKLVVDGAHNASSAEALAKWLKRQPRPKNRILLFGMGQGRDPATVVAPLLPYVHEIVTTRCAHPKAWDPMSLAVTLSEVLDATISAGTDVEETLPEVLEDADEVIATGSLFIAGAVRSIALDGSG